MEIIKKNVLNKKNIKVQLEEHIIWLIIGYACDRNPIFNTIPRFNTHLLVRYAGEIEEPYIGCCYYCKIPLYIRLKRRRYLNGTIQLTTNVAIELRLGSVSEFVRNRIYDICANCLPCHQTKEPNWRQSIWQWQDGQYEYLSISYPFSN